MHRHCGPRTDQVWQVCHHHHPHDVRNTERLRAVGYLQVDRAVSQRDHLHAGFRFQRERPADGELQRLPQLPPHPGEPPAERHQDPAACGQRCQRCPAHARDGPDLARKGRRVPHPHRAFGLRRGCQPLDRLDRCGDQFHPRRGHSGMAPLLAGAARLCGPERAARRHPQGQHRGLQVHDDHGRAEQDPGLNPRRPPRPWVPQHPIAALGHPLH
mmetsp:Transcript_92503/g.160342  ORF Transcript_92503/g.160342 Transcript_92503/m.160342 type:complete len:214 (+) Transcript_92503:1139-1780(+)